MTVSTHRILIYGLGMVFVDLFINHNFASKVLCAKNYKIVGLIDKNSNKIFKKYVNYPIISKGEINKIDFDYIVITSAKFYEEIKFELMNINVEENKILSLMSIIEDWYYDIFNVKFIQEKNGLEIGGPSIIFSHIYQNCKRCDGINFKENTIWWKKESENYTYNDKILGKIYISDATDLSNLKNCSYDFILSSNNLEHIANPLKALKEWYRLLNKNGKIILLVPRKDVTFDHNRPYTSFEHILRDFENNICEDDLSHLIEIIKLHDYKMDVECGGRKSFIKRSYRNFENRCLHHHVFDEKCLRKLCKFLNMKENIITAVPGNYLAIWEKD